MPNLTEAKIKKLKFDGKNFKVTDGYGLYLLVAKKSKRFYCRYTYRKQQFDVPIGEYPFISLAQARERVFAIRSNLANGLPPLMTKITDKTFDEICQEFLSEFSNKVAYHTLESTMSRYRLYLQNAPLASVRISQVTPQDILSILSPLRKDGKETTAKKVLSLINSVFRYGIEHYGLQENPAYVLSQMKIAVKPYQTVHHQPFSREDLSVILSKLDDDDFSPVADALRLLPHIFVRIGELCSAHIDDFDLSEKLWRISADKMKLRRVHLVPLSRQAMAIIERRIALAENGFLFPSRYGKTDFISKCWTTTVFRQKTGSVLSLHSFRSTASTLLHELGFHSDLIELQLSHKIRNNTAAPYNFATFLDERRDMLQFWSNFLDKLKSENDLFL